MGSNHAQGSCVVQSYSVHSKSMEIRPLPRVAAIIPAYNEHTRISHVIHALTACPLIAEVIVVDDGSSPPLHASVEGFSSIRVIRHNKQRGKAAAMETGVRATDAECIFFCDADLVGITAKHVATLVLPVISNTHRMSVGIRRNRGNRLIRVFALNSGERCLSRTDWHALPVFFKHGFRIETGLNATMWLQGDPIFFQRFPYSQTVRERKYGFVAGMAGRVRMIVDITLAWGFAGVLSITRFRSILQPRRYRE